MTFYAGGDKWLLVTISKGKRPSTKTRPFPGKAAQMSPMILLVDEDRLLREVLQEYLAARGYALDAAENNIEALRLLEPGKYGLALIGQGMKQESGLKLLKEIRKLHRDMVCVIMTSYTNLHDIFKNLEDERTDYLLKPFQLSELHNMVKKYLP